MTRTRIPQELGLPNHREPSPLGRCGSAEVRETQISQLELPIDTSNFSYSNWILDRLRDAEGYRLLDYLKTIAFHPKDRIYDSGEPLGMVYFPTRGGLTLRKSMQSGGTIEIATIGNDGCYGFPSCAEETDSPYQAAFESPGNAYAVQAAVFREEYDRNATLRRLIDFSRAAILATASQWAACNGLHSVVQRCCRRVLEAADRYDSDEVSLTHERIAVMLGVRRPSVSDAFSPLVDRGILGHTRGKIVIVDRPALKRLACECFETDRESRQRLLARFDTAQIDSG